MKLADYLSKERLTDAAFAARISRDRSFVTRLRLGAARPSFSTISSIMVATNGAVSADDFLPAPDQGRT